MTSALRGLAENNFGDTRSGGLAGPMGLFIILLMAVATVLLIRNMSRRIRRLPAEFPSQASPRRSGPRQHGPRQHGSGQHGSADDPGEGPGDPGRQARSGA